MNPNETDYLVNEADEGESSHFSDVLQVFVTDFNLRQGAGEAKVREVERKIGGVTSELFILRKLLQDFQTRVNDDHDIILRLQHEIQSLQHRVRSLDDKHGAYETQGGRLDLRIEQLREQLDHNTEETQQNVSRLIGNLARAHLARCSNRFECSGNNVVHKDEVSRCDSISESSTTTTATTHKTGDTQRVSPEKSPKPAENEAVTQDTDTGSSCRSSSTLPPTFHPTMVEEEVSNEEFRAKVEQGSASDSQAATQPLHLCNETTTKEGVLQKSTDADTTSQADHGDGFVLNGNIALQKGDEPCDSNGDDACISQECSELQSATTTCSDIIVVAEDTVIQHVIAEANASDSNVSQAVVADSTNQEEEEKKSMTQEGAEPVQSNASPTNSRKNKGKRSRGRKRKDSQNTENPSSVDDKSNHEPSLSDATKDSQTSAEPSAEAVSRQNHSSRANRKTSPSKKRKEKNNFGTKEQVTMTCEINSSHNSSYEQNCNPGNVEPLDQTGSQADKYDSIKTDENDDDDDEPPPLAQVDEEVRTNTSEVAIPNQTNDQDSVEEEKEISQLSEENEISQLPEENEISQLPEENEISQLPEENEISQLPTPATEDQQTTQHTEEQAVTFSSEDQQTTQHMEEQTVTISSEDQQTTQHIEEQAVTISSEDQQTTQHTEEQAVTISSEDQQTTQHTEEQAITISSDYEEQPEDVLNERDTQDSKEEEEEVPIKPQRSFNICEEPPNPGPSRNPSLHSRRRGHHAEAEEEEMPDLSDADTPPEEGVCNTSKDKELRPSGVSRIEIKSPTGEPADLQPLRPRKEYKSMETPKNDDQKDEVVGMCANCSNLAKLRCGNCRQAFYCKRECQKDHWKNGHKDQCRPYQVLESSELGRYMVASRDLKAGDVILKEDPMVVGPKQITEPICLGCYKRVDGSYRCQKCHWPLCGPQCEKLPDHQPECVVGMEIGSPIEISNFDEPNHFYEVVFPLRCMALKKKSPKKYEQLMALDSHYDDRKGAHVYNENQKSIVNVLRNYFLLQQFPIEDIDSSEKSIHTVTGIIDVNALELRLSEAEVLGLYPNFAMMEHSCTPNTKHNFTEGRQVVLKAAVDIKRGEHLSTMYTHILWGTLARRDHLKHSKYFMCTCFRCSDPTELGTNFSTIRCRNCPTGFMLSAAPLDELADWLCTTCSETIKNDEVTEINLKLGEEVEKILADPTVPILEELLQKHAKSTVHPNHYHLFATRHTLLQMYGRDPNYANEEFMKKKERMCQDFLKVCTALDPGMARLSPYAGVALYEYHLAVLSRTRQDPSAQQTDPAALKKDVETAKALLQQCIKVLQDEPKDQPEGQLCHVAQQNLIELRQWEANLFSP